MTGFFYDNDVLTCDGISIDEIINETGTPCYVYSQQKLISNFKNIQSQLSDVDYLICYALKANGNVNLLKTLSDHHCGADVVSGGELMLALKAGIPPEKIVYAGVGKTDEEIQLAIEQDIYSINAESIEEIKIIHEIAQRMQKKVRIAIRVNPDIEVHSHPHIVTGVNETKFGVESDRIGEAFKLAASLPGLKVEGIHCHLGSMIDEIEPFRKCAQFLGDWVQSLRENGINLKNIDLGGGLGVDYAGIVKHPSLKPVDKQPPTPTDLFDAVLPILKPLNVKVVFEPGRYVIADAGALITRVILNKSAQSRKFTVVDAGMNDLIRPSLYDAYHQIVPVKLSGHHNEKISVVGPICETGDYFALDREMPHIRRGELLALMAAGAYGYSLSSNYNGRPRAAEVMVEGQGFRIIRKRETIDQLWQGVTGLDK